MRKVVIFVICPVCKMRYAEFPPEDFRFEEGVGFIPIKEDSEERRLETFNSDKVEMCGECGGCVYYNRMAD